MEQNRYVLQLKKFWVLSVIIILVLVLNPAITSAGKDDNDVIAFSRQKIEKGEETKGSSDDYDEDAAASCILVGAITIFSPFWLPYSALGDNYSTLYSFHKYPYKDGKEEFLVRREDTGKRYAGYVGSLMEFVGGGTWAWGFSGEAIAT